MRIAMVSEHASPLATLGGADAGGQNVHVAELARALVARGHRVTVYTRHDAPGQPPRVTTADGVVVEHVPVGPKRHVPNDELLRWTPEFGDWLRDRLAEQRPDLVHAHSWMSGLAARSATEALHLPLVQTFHALGAVQRWHQAKADTSPPERIDAERVLVRTADRIIATSSDEVLDVVRLGGEARRTSVVPCGVDTDLFAALKELPPPAPMLRILWIGRLVPRKGVDDVIRALRLVPAAELLIAGGPPAVDLDQDPHVLRLRRLARHHGVAGRVRFVGAVPHEQVPQLMRSAYVVVSVPWYEPFGMVALEAMASGVPIVASAVGGHRDTVVHATTGLLVPPRSPQSLAAALRALAHSPALRFAYGMAGADRVRVRYCWPRIAQETEDAYTLAFQRAGPVGVA